MTTLRCSLGVEANEAVEERLPSTEAKEEDSRSPHRQALAALGTSTAARFHSSAPAARAEGVQDRLQSVGEASRSGHFHGKVLMGSF